MHAMLETLAAELRTALGNGGELIGIASNGPPRFELFHGANSICSHKVRMVLAHHRIPYVSRSMNIFAGETYMPSHVRLRMIGCDRLGTKLMTTHDGSTSATFGGCDPAVVPTLVDWDTEQVIVDSKRACIYLDDLATDTGRLLPAHLSDAIHAELDIVDNLPNYQMLTGRPPGADKRPEKLRGSDGVDFSSSKVQRCDRYLAEFAGDATLVEAYEAKRLKELEGSRRLFSADAMRAAYAKAASACEELSRKLMLDNKQWLFGNTLTMADLFWAVELLRMKNLGAGTIWENGALPPLEKFVNAVERLPCMRLAVLDWPGALY